MPRMTGGRFLAETMHGYGITHAFFVPVIAQRAMLEMEKLGIRHIMTHGEKAAAYMADGYARASHKIGICMAQSVGAANMAAGLQDPYLARSPVVAITGRREHLGQHRNAYQEVDHLQPFRAVTKYSVPVDSAEQLPYLLRQAFREATSGSPGPVHLDWEGTSGNVVSEGEADLDVIIEEPFTSVPAYRPEPEREMVREAAKVLTSARRPVIVAGGGVTLSGAQDEVRQLAEMMSIPVATSLNAKTALPGDHPLLVGVCGSYSRTCANRVVSEADLVVYIGSHTGSQVTNEWTVPAPGAPVLQIDIDPSELGRSYPAQATLQGDARSSIRSLMEVLEPVGQRTEWVNRAQDLVREWREDVAPLVNADTSPVRPERLCKGVDRLPALRCRAGVGHRTLGYLDRHYDRPQPRRPAVRPVRRFVGLGASGHPGSEVRAAGQASDRVQRGRRLLVPYVGIGDCGAVRHQRRDRRQQQPFAEPGKAEQRAGLRRGTQQPRFAVAHAGRRLFEDSRGHRMLRHPGGPTGADPERIGAGIGVGEASGG